MKIIQILRGIEDDYPHCLTVLTDTGRVFHGTLDTLNSVTGKLQYAWVEIQGPPEALGHSERAREV